MIRLSANLGFLFRDRPLADAIRAAAAAGFQAVECHFPYDTPPADVAAACADTGLPMLSLNTRPGDRFGFAALPGREVEARAEIDRAVEYAAATGTAAVHVMAGTHGEMETFAANLAHAAARAAPHGITVLIEPLNDRDTPGYTLTTCAQAMALQDRVGADNLKIMYDCYHRQIMEGDLLTRARAMLDRIGHVQFAAVPDRGEPDRGEVDYRWLLPALADAGYAGHFGAEYRPRGGDTEAGLGWMEPFR